MIGVNVIGVERAQAHLAAGSRALKDGTGPVLRRAALLVQRQLRARVSAPGSSHPFWGKQSQPTGIAALTGRSGKTRQRITIGPVLKIPGFGGDAYSVPVGSPDKHLALAEEGGVVTGNQFLRIPTAKAQTAAGVDINAGRSVRGIPGYRLIRTAAAKLWIVRDAGGPKSQRVDFMYLLKRSIRIRPRRIFAITRHETEGPIARMMSGLVGEVVRRANG